MPILVSPSIILEKEKTKAYKIKSKLLTTKTVLRISGEPFLHLSIWTTTMVYIS
jgi:hypothetical protein